MTQRTVALIEVDTSTWTGGSLPPKQVVALHGKPLTFEVPDLLRHIAWRTAPPVGFGFELSYYWPHLRYLPALSSGPALGLRKEWRDIDSHQKTILSDDFGMGFSSLIVSDYLDVPFEWIIPTNWAIGAINKWCGTKVFSLKASGKRGPKKSPDFIGISPQTKSVHVFECKGTQTANILDGQVIDGQKQKANFQCHVPGMMGQSLVIGLYIPQDGSKTASRCRISDPPVREEPNNTAQIPDLLPVFAQGHLASTLQLLGLHRQGEAVAGGHWDEARTFRDLVPWMRAARPYEQFTVVTRDIMYPRDIPVLCTDSKAFRGVRMSFGIETRWLERLAEHPASHLLEEIADTAQTSRAQFRRPPGYKNGAYVAETPSGTLFRLDFLD